MARMHSVDAFITSIRTSQVTSHSHNQRSSVMKKVVFLIVLVSIVFSVNGFCQESTPKVEVFSGYSYERLEDWDLNGWRATVAWNQNNWLALVADVNGQYDARNSIAFGAPSRANLKAYTLLFGPQFSLRTKARITPFSQVLTGVSRITGSVVSLDRPRRSETRSEFTLATG